MSRRSDEGSNGDDNVGQLLPLDECLPLSEILVLTQI